jgi:hypothetical protein
MTKEGRKFMRVSSLMISLALALPYGGRAEEPAAPPSAAGNMPAATTAAPGETNAATGAATATDPPVEQKTPAQLKREAAEAKIRQSGAYGYKPETTKSGDVLYCKRETPIGTHFEQKQCRTFEQLRDEALRGKEYLEQMQHVVPPAKG